MSVSDASSLLNNNRAKFRLSDKFFEDMPYANLMNALDHFFVYFPKTLFEARVRSLQHRSSQATGAARNYEWTLNKIMRHQGLMNLQGVEPRRAMWVWFQKGWIIPGVLQQPALGAWINEAEYV